MLFKWGETSWWLAAEPYLWLGRSLKLNSCIGSPYDVQESTNHVENSFHFCVTVEWRCVVHLYLFQVIHYVFELKATLSHWVSKVRLKWFYSFWSTYFLTAKSSVTLYFSRRSIYPPAALLILECTSFHACDGSNKTDIRLCNNLF